MALTPRGHASSNYGNGQRASFVLTWGGAIAPGDLLIGVLMTKEGGVDVYDVPGWARVQWNAGANTPSAILMYQTAAVFAGSLTMVPTKPAEGQWRTWTIPAGEWNPTNGVVPFAYGVNDVGPQMPYIANLEAQLGPELWPHANGMFACTMAGAARINGAANVLPGGTDYDWNADVARPAGSGFYAVSGRSQNTYNTLRVYDPGYPNLANASVPWRSLSLLVYPKVPPNLHTLNASDSNGTWTLTASASQHPESYRFDWGDGNVDTQASGTKSHAYQYGTYTARVTATNNKGTSNERTVAVNIPRPTITNVSASVAGLVASFTATTTGLPGGASTWKWDFGDGSAVVDGLSHAQRAYAPGDYTVTVYVTTLVGDSTVYTYQLNVPPPAPVAKITWVRTPGTYVVTVKDLSSWNVTASNVWKVDGVTEQTGGAEFIHDLGGEGQYELTLEVVNVTGTDSATQFASITNDYTAIDRADGITVAIVAGTDDITCEAMTATWTFGALDDEGPLTTPTAGRLELQLLDRERKLDPNNSLATTPLTVGLDLYMYAGPTGSTQPLQLMWRGWIERAVHDGSTMRISGYDAIGRMTAAKAAQDGPNSRPAEGLSTRLVALLDTVAWPSALRDITSDSTQLAATTYVGSDIWGQLVRATEGRGHVSVDTAGKVRYRPRHLFTPDTPEIALHCDDLVEVIDSTELPKVINDAVVGNAETGTRRAQDASSQASYGIQSTNLDVPFTAGTVLDAAASDIITAMARPRLKQEAELRVPAAKVSTYTPLAFGRQVNVQHVAYYRPGSVLLGGRWSMGLEQTELTALAVLPDYLAPAQLAAPTAGTYGLGGRAGVVQHDHEGGILRPASLEVAQWPGNCRFWLQLTTEVAMTAGQGLYMPISTYGADGGQEYSRYFAYQSGGLKIQRTGLYYVAFTLAFINGDTKTNGRFHVNGNNRNFAYISMKGPEGYAHWSGAWPMWLLEGEHLALYVDNQGAAGTLRGPFCYWFAAPMFG